MNFMALITARFADLPFFTSAAKKSKQASKPNTVRVKRSSTADRDTPAQLGPYQCTSIVFEDSACDAVKAIGRKRFLVVDRDTPTLPLSECDRSRCNCKYMRHNDRREEEDDDRRLAAALQTALYEDNGNEDRRMKNRGRRKTDS